MNLAHIAKMAGVTALAAALTSGCSWTGLNSTSLPFTKGRGGDAIVVTVQLANAANLVPNSEVKYDEVTIGSVRKIKLKDWTATLTVGLEPDVLVPADVTATVAQKSLLGAEYLALEDATTTTTTVSTASGANVLETGDVIGLERTGRYPETEEVLSAASLLLNGGGLSQVRTITHELNEALDGRHEDFKSFMRTVSTFTSRLDGQRDNIAATLTQLDRLALAVTQDRGKVESALQRLPEGLRVLSAERKQLVRTLQSLDSFGKVAHRVIGATKLDFQQNLANLRPITRALAESGDELADSVDMVTYPFPARQANKAATGDYINLLPTINVSAGALARDWLGGTPLDGLFTGFIAGTPTGPAAESADPLSSDLLEGLLGDDGLVGGLTKPRANGDDSAPSTPLLDGLLDQLLGGL